MNWLNCETASNVQHYSRRRSDFRNFGWTVELALALALALARMTQYITITEKITFVRPFEYLHIQSHCLMFSFLVFLDRHVDMDKR